MSLNKDKNTSMTGEDDLIRIFKSLNFEEQLCLARENDLQRNVFENHIWKMNYRTLNIYKPKEGSFVITNETNVNHVVLTDIEALRHFIEFYAKNVKILIFYQNKGPFRKRWVRQDTELDDLIPIIAKSLEHLESLEFRGFCVDDSFKKSENVNALLHMKNLKRLCLKHFLASEIKYKYFCQLASKLEVLKFAGVLSPDVDDDNSETEHSTLTHFEQLKELQIYTSFDPKDWSHKYLSFLTTFKSLTTLSIGINNEIDDCMWQIFVTNCQELEKLSISDSNFKNITQFFVPPKLTVFSLDWCQGLTYNNLQQILQEAKLTEFISLHTKYEGEFQDFKIATTIRTLHMDDSDMCKCRLAYESNDNLKNLKWNETRKSCTNTNCMTSLALCRNLETLYLKPLTQVTLDTLLQLNHLRELTTSIDNSTQWPCLIDLLKHSSSRNLTVEIGGKVGAVPTKGFPINISNLNVYNLLEEDGFALDFLLDLFSQNPDLTVSLWTPSICLEMSLKLINHEKFPKKMKTVVVRGFTLDCDDLRKNFTDSFKIVANCPRILLETPDIVLSWK